MNITEYIQSCNVNELMNIQKLISCKMEEDYHKKENFFLHDKIDDYTYVVDYIDGSYHYHCVGSKAYERYIRDNDAIAIRRKTKDLFPIYEELLRKEFA